MQRKYFVLLFFLMFITAKSYSQPGFIVIKADYSGAVDVLQGMKGKDIISFKDMDGKTPKPPVETIKPTIYKNVYTWRIPAAGAKLLFGAALHFSGYSFAEPGDSIHIQFRNSVPEYAGKGGTRFQLLYAIEKINKSFINPVPTFRTIDPTTGRRTKIVLTVKEYLLLCKYYDQQLDGALKLLDQNKHLLSQLDYDWLKASTIYHTESSRLGVFYVTSFTVNKKFNIDTTYSQEYKHRIFDSTMNQSPAVWLRAQNDLPGLSGNYFYGFSRAKVWKRFNWDLEHNDTLASKPMRVKMVYDQLVKDYKNFRLEQALALSLLDEEVTQEMGAWNPVAQRLLKDYYSRSQFPAYKKWIQSLEAKRQYTSKSKNGLMPFFQLIDTKGKLFTEKNIAGKFTVIHFWYTGCKDCKENIGMLQQQQDRFKNDSNVLFLNISLDNNQITWLQNKDQGIFSPKGGIQLWAGKKGKDHEMLKDLNVGIIPSVRLIRPNGTILVTGKQEPNMASNNGRWLADLILTQKSYPGDGPYVWQNGHTRKAFYIKDEKIIEDTSLTDLKIATDLPDQVLLIDLQKNVSIPPSTYPATDKMLVLSDIEGHFSALRTLLQATGVIDDHFNWTFEKGHLVFTGDMFDRGEQVTECLWLIYSLEEKARSNGGMVHFILGNHEIMNLNGQDNYVQQKYKSNYKLLGKTLAEVYGDNTELGHWLRSKNIVEKIGDYLFCHGGISPHVNNLDITIDGINEKARPYYARSREANQSADKVVAILYNASKSPFWYRQYYDKDHFSQSNKEMIWHASEAQVDSTCEKFGIKHIVTGHTIVADTISVHYKGKVINTDVHHAEGQSEALFIEDAKHYRVNSTGTRILLFKEETNTAKKMPKALSSAR